MVFSPSMTLVCTFACSINNHMLIRQLFCFLILFFIKRLCLCDFFIRLSQQTIMKVDRDWIESDRNINTAVITLEMINT